MIEYSRTTISREGKATIGEFTYRVSISIENDSLASVAAQVNKIDDPQTGNQGEHIGAIQSNGGRLILELYGETSVPTHSKNFDAILAEVKESMQQSEIELKVRK